MKNPSGMSRKKAIVLMLTITILVVSGCSKTVSDRDRFSVTAENGRIDLSTWNPGFDPVISLDGDWAFYWERLIPPDEFLFGNHHLTMTQTVPGLWNQYSGNQNFWPGDGFATYRLLITEITDSSKDYYLLIPEMPTASRVWVNGRTVSQKGRVSDTSGDSVPFLRTSIVRVEPTLDGEIDIVLHISNFTHKDGGIWHSFKLGTHDLLFSEQEFPALFDMFIFGILFIMGLYHLGLFALRYKDRAPLYFGCFCLLIASRSMVVGQRVMLRILDSTNWPLCQRFEYAILFLSTPAFILFFYHLFPGSLSRRFCWILNGLSFGFLLLAFFFPLRLVNYSGNFFQIITIFTAFYIFYSAMRLARNGVANSRLFLCGYTLLLLTVINDFIYTHQLLHTRTLIHFGAFLFILFQALLLSGKNARSMRQVERISSELEGKNRELVRLNQLKDEFLANTSHELKTPLHGIMGLSNTLLDDPVARLTKAQKSILKMISGSGKRLFNLINDLLDYSKLQRDDLRLIKKATDIRALTESVVAFIRPMTGAKPVTLSVSGSDSLPNVLCDENRIQQVLFNLIENAVKYTLNGCIEISVSTTSNDTVTLSINDTGIGIEPEKLSRIFNAFEQGYDDENQYFQGMGLGLSITKQLLDLHGSRLSVKSEPGVGSCFSFELPVSKSAPDDNRAEERPVYRYIAENSEEAPDSFDPESVFSDTITKKILIVDDEPVNLKLVSMQLRHHGFEFCIAHNGNEALETIEEDKPDLVLLDIMMPGISGYDVCTQLRESYSVFELPIILLTAKNRLDDVVKGFQCGANDYISKPFYKEELLARITTLLEASESLRRLKNNELLTKEIGRRKEVENRLRTVQRRMIRILDASSEAIVSVNREGLIFFFNQQAEKWLHYSSAHIVNEPVACLLDEKGSQYVLNALADMEHAEHLDTRRTQKRITIRDGNREEFDSDVRVISFLIEKEPMVTLVFSTQSEGPGHVADDPAIEGALSELPLIAKSKNKLSLTELRTTPMHLDGLQDRLPTADITTLDTDSQEAILRESLVSLMLTSLTLWEASSGKTKIDLAEESTLWKAYLDRGTYKTRTLDKYLSVKTLPKKPRWREIIKTAYFVLASCTLSEKDEAHLNALITKTEYHLGNM